MKIETTYSVEINEREVRKIIASLLSEKTGRKINVDDLIPQYDGDYDTVEFSGYAFTIQD